MSWFLTLSSIWAVFLKFASDSIYAVRSTCVVLSLTISSACNLFCSLSLSTLMLDCSRRLIVRAFFISSALKFWVSWFTFASNYSLRPTSSSWFRVINMYSSSSLRRSALSLFLCFSNDSWSICSTIKFCFSCFFSSNSWSILLWKSWVSLSRSC